MRKGIVFILLFLVFQTGMTVAALEISAKSAVVINGDTGELIFEKNAGERLPMASTTKIMTALLLCEQGEPEKSVTVSADMLRVEGSSMGLLAGDTVTYRDLLYGMLLASGNDAANATAFLLDGSIEKFAERMNRRAAELGLADTHFVSLSGLHAEGHYTTATDLSNLARKALQNDEFAKAASSDSAICFFGNPPYRRTLKNHNKLLNTVDGVIGVKTGFTKKSGRCLVSAMKKDGKYVIAVTLNDPNDWADHKLLLQYGIDSVTTTDYMPGIARYSLPVIGGVSQTLDIEITPFSVNTVHTEAVTAHIVLPRFAYAPVNRDEPVGSITYYLDKTMIGSVMLYPQTDVAAKAEHISFAEKIKENLARLLSGFREL